MTVTMSSATITNTSMSLLSIPSPSFNSIELGPLTFTLYGLMIGLGIIGATVLARPRSLARRLHPDTPLEMLVWVVPAGIIGARLYHVLTDWRPITEWHRIWEGGLGVPGAIGGGLIGGLLFVRQRGLDRNRVMDAVIPGVPLAQAVGRIGNWWNQEVYGRPTDLPWALEIDAEHRVDGFETFETFHPTFLYELIWNLGIVVLLIWLDRRKVLKPGRLIWVYAGAYALGRLVIETIRIDAATEILGLRVNIWTMGALLVASVLVLRNSFAEKSVQVDDDYAEDRASDSGSDGDTETAASDEEE